MNLQCNVVQNNFLTFGNSSLRCSKFIIHALTILLGNPAGIQVTKYRFSQSEQSSQYSQTNSEILANLNGGHFRRNDELSPKYERATASESGLCTGTMQAHEHGQVIVTLQSSKCTFRFPYGNIMETQCTSNDYLGSYPIFSWCSSYFCAWLCRII